MDRLPRVKIGDKKRQESMFLKVNVKNPMVVQLFNILTCEGYTNLKLGD